MYAYQADTYCDSCGERIAADLTARGLAPVNLENEHSFDTADYPKHERGEETDSPDHCASGSDCLEAVDLAAYGFAANAPRYAAESARIGALLSDGLTPDGAQWLADTLREKQPDTDPTPYQVALYAYWREAFADELSSLPDRTILVHLNVTVPAMSALSASAVSEMVSDALEQLADTCYLGAGWADGVDWTIALYEEVSGV